MVAEAPTKPPRWYWIVCALAVAWGILGCLACFTQLSMGPEDLAKLPEPQRDIWRATPQPVRRRFRCRQARLSGRS